jgi:crotonobetainyl-CoA:carnitine CoA-transferase CaiB-like acyl-CoA transferase
MNDGPDQASRPAAERQGPLAGVRVVDISSFLAAPKSGMFLADLGADVIKVEQPGRGDEMRYWGHDKGGVGLYFKVINRGKRTVTADYRTPLGVAIVKRLAATADILVENYRPGTIEKWGLGPDVLQAINPKLIIVRVSAYGQTGPYSHRPGFGTLAEAYSGFAHINGHADGPPLLPGYGMADATTGLMAAYLALAALTEQRRSGKGQVVDLAIYETLMTLMGPQIVDYDQLGHVQMRNGSRLPFTAPRNTYRTRDGKWVSISGSAQSTFERMCDALEVPHLPKDPRFLDNRLRLQKAKELDDELQAAIEKFDMAEVMRRFEKAEAAVAPVNDTADIYADPQIQARQSIATVPDEELGPMRMQNVVGRLSRTPGEITHAGPPVGRHNLAILVEELGFTEAELRAAGLPVD